MKFAPSEIFIIHAGDLDLASCGGFYIFRNLYHIIVIEIKARHRIVGLRMLRFLLDGKGLAVLVKFYHAVLSRVSHIVAEDGRAVFSDCHSLKHLGKALSVENVVTQDQRHVIVADEFLTDDESVCQSSGTLLNCIGNIDSQLFSVA